MAESSYDYIVVGGGLAGCVVASRIHENLPTASVLVLEAGEDPVNHPLTAAPLACFGVHHSDLDWDYTTIPQKHLDNRPRYQAAAKALGGGSSINYGTWMRGSKADYDRWAAIVGDERWSYDQLLPYFKRVEAYDVRRGADDLQHSSGGLIHAVSVSHSHPSRKYPLRDIVRAAWESIGIRYIPDANGGYPQGLSEYVENWKEGKRQFVHLAYQMTGMHIRTKTLVARVIISQNQAGDKIASGVELADGSRINARKEVIVSCGAYRTPQLLLLSGLGPTAELQKHGIPQVVDIPEVGLDFHDHLAIALIWKLTKREHDLPLSVLGSTPAFGMGLPADWVVLSGMESDTLRHALAKDGQDEPSPFSHALLNPNNCFTETLNVYAPAGANHAGMDIPFKDGSYLSTPILGMLPTSRGSISLNSKDPSAQPRIDPNYYATEVDRAALRAGVRRALRVYLGTEPLKDVIESEVPPDGFPSLRADSSDEDIDARIRRVGNTFFHAGGSCAMGKVVDGELRVHGVKGLRVVDASVLPTPVSAHYQVCVYTLAERAADFIIESGK